jgi:hypothetical protein
MDAPVKQRRRSLRPVEYAPIYDIRCAECARRFRRHRAPTLLGWLGQYQGEPKDAIYEPPVAPGDVLSPEGFALHRMEPGEWHVIGAWRQNRRYNGEPAGKGWLWGTVLPVGATSGMWCKKGCATPRTLDYEALMAQRGPRPFILA